MFFFLFCPDAPHTHTYVNTFTHTTLPQQHKERTVSTFFTIIALQLTVENEEGRKGWGWEHRIYNDDPCPSAKHASAQQQESGRTQPHRHNNGKKKKGVKVGGKEMRGGGCPVTATSKKAPKRSTEPPVRKEGDHEDTATARVEFEKQRQRKKTVQ
jgi:hypothetical protein